jgi:flavin reductase (DIM6/NTAB) family NADH-FMN oxidoreductase RutF
MSIHSYDPATGHGLKHDPLNSIVGPRPIGWISTIDKDGKPNLAPYSFFNLFNYTPPILGFASVGWKDTVRNVGETGEFVWNLATRPLAQQMNLSCKALPHGEDEFAFSGLTPVPSARVAAPRVQESPVAFECRVIQSIRLQTKEGEPINTWLTLGEVVMIHVDSALIIDGVYDVAAAQPILRAGRGGDYVEVTRDRMFEMPRPG